MNYSLKDQPFEFKTERRFVQYKHFFSKSELLELGDTINKQIREKAQIELDKKSAMSTFKNKIEAMDCEINVTSNYISDKHKFEPVEALVRINAYQKAFEYIHPENGELIQTELMNNKQIRMHYPKTKDFETKTMVWFNPYDGVMVDSRMLEDDELQLDIEDGNEGQ